MFSEIKTKPLKIMLFLLGFFLALAALGFFLLAWQRPRTGEQLEALSQEDLAKLAKPSVVRVINRVQGVITMPSFSIEDSSLSIAIDSAQKPKQYQIDEFLAGSGVIINPEGYILTNSHVISTESVKRLYLENAVNQELELAIRRDGEAKLANILQNEQTLLLFLEKAAVSLEKLSSFQLDSLLSVPKPSSSQENLEFLAKSGFQAEVVAINDNFRIDEMDMGLIKINASDLPSLLLEDSGQVSIGSKIFVIGYPSTADVNSRTPMEPTFTQGVVSAAKFSQNKDFEMFQTDAKISTGSSGGPMLNEQGKVVGLITLITGSQGLSEGDSFAFALPASMAKGLLSRLGIKNVEGEHSIRLKSALNHISQYRCREALAELAKAVTHPDFDTKKIYSSYRERCSSLISNNLSRDSWLQDFRHKLYSANFFSRFVVIGRIILVLLAIWSLAALAQRMGRDENRIREISQELKEEKAEQLALLEQLNKKGIILPAPETELHSQDRLKLSIPHPHLAEFVQQARLAGMKDEDISAELVKAGWKEKEIRHALLA